MLFCNTIKTKFVNRLFDDPHDLHRTVLRLIPDMITKMGTTQRKSQFTYFYNRSSNGDTIYYRSDESESEINGNLPQGSRIDFLGLFQFEASHNNGKRIVTDQAKIAEKFTKSINQGGARLESARYGSGRNYYPVRDPLVRLRNDETRRFDGSFHVSPTVILGQLVVTEPAEFAKLVSRGVGKRSTYGLGMVNILRQS